MTAALREKIFVLPPGADFADAFAKGFQQRYSGQAPEIRARTIILVNTGRARKMIEDALAALSPGPLPRLTLIPDLAADPALAPDQPLALAPLRRQLRLTGLVEQFLTAKYRAGETIAPVGAAADLAESLAMLIDQFHDSGVPPDTLDGLVDGSDLAEASARHWQQTLVFVDIVRRAWPGIRDELEQGRLDPRARQRIAIEALIEAWRTAPPKSKVRSRFSVAEICG